MGGQVQCVREQGMGEEEQVLAAMDLMEALILGQRHLGFKGVKTWGGLQKWWF